MLSIYSLHSMWKIHTVCYLISNGITLTFTFMLLPVKIMILSTGVIFVLGKTQTVFSNSKCNFNVKFNTHVNDFDIPYEGMLPSLVEGH